MNRLARVVGMDGREIVGRLVQAVRAHLERWSDRLGVQPPSEDAFVRRHVRTGSVSPLSVLEAFRSRCETAPFEGLRDPGETGCWIASRRPEAWKALRERADGILDGRVKLLGHEISLEPPVQWHVEPVTGKRLPLHHWTLIDHLAPDVAGEYKVLWELNRHQFLLDLGQAYAGTGDRRYADGARLLIDGWIEANPPGRGINWSSSLELAYRAIAWTWCLMLLRDSDAVDGEFYLRCLRHLYLHGRHVERHLSTYYSPNTHLTGEALGLLYLGTMFPELRRAGAWREKGIHILETQLPVQVHEDGAYFEHATGYHGYTVDIYLHFWILSKHLGRPLSRQKRGRIEKAIEHLRYVTRPDGRVPLVGDDDGGRLLPLGGRAPSDFRDSLAVGSALTGRGDLVLPADEPTHETAWLLGSGVEVPRAVAPHRLSRSFPAGGFHVLRDGWEETACYLLLSCGPHGAIGGGHAHADALSVEVVADGSPVIVDPGTVTYRSDHPLRDRLRSSKAHNTVTVDGENFAVPAGPFSWSRTPSARTELFHSGPGYDVVQGSHDGYAFLADSVTHRRTILFVHGAGWIFRDRIESEGEHRLDLRFHLASGLEPVLTGDGAMIPGRDGEPRVLVHAVGSADGRFLLEDSVVASGYGTRRSSMCLRWSQTGHGIQEVVTLLCAGGRGRDAELEGAGEAVGLDFGDGGRVWVGRESGIRTADVETDGSVLWIREDHSRGGVMGARRVRVRGRRVLDEREPSAWVELPTDVRDDGGVRSEASASSTRSSVPEADL